MKNDPQINSDVSDVVGETSATVQSAADKGRRRWVSGAGIGAVLLSAKTGSALANGVCMSPSGFKSIEANPRTSHRPQSYEGSCNSHGYYCSHPERMGDFCNKKLSDYNLAAPSGCGSNTTLKDVVCKTGDFADARDLVTVLLDYLLGYQTVVNLLDVQYAWGVCYSGARPQGSRFEGWSKSDIRAYLDVYVGNTHI